RGGRERLDDVAVGAGLGSRDDVLLLGLGRYHQHGQALQVRVQADLLEHFQAVEVRHVPVGHDELEAAGAQLVQRHRAVFRLVDVLETQFLEQVADDASHGGEVVHHQNLQSLVYHLDSKSKYYE